MLYRFRMYSCNDDSWKELEHGFDFHLGFPSSCVVVKGNPFWIGLDGDMKEILLCVDVESEVIRVFSGPDYVETETTYTSILALEDKAAQIVYSLGTDPNNFINVYALEESSGVWTLIYNIESMGLQMPILFNCYRNGKFVMKGKHCRLFTYDTELQVVVALKALISLTGDICPFLSIMKSSFLENPPPDKLAPPMLIQDMKVYSFRVRILKL
ncbi:hypothetical protein POM88_040671 [Heracleum sosnowskyi]|uniref:F-box associated beta-propeller type 1 domain-containing protein n=1 Tax=Heracleum sosnowskyi TaxID=360622 RepID=A0AAD8HFB4_9APIA|nr:hypothetical protein POM88_040671 [Heracleum sosnowskyi]